MSLAEVENMATMQLFTLGGYGGHAPPENFVDFKHSEAHSEAYREAHQAS